MKKILFFAGLFLLIPALSVAQFDLSQETQEKLTKINKEISNLDTQELEKLKKRIQDNINENHQNPKNIYILEKIHNKIKQELQERNQEEHFHEAPSEDTDSSYTPSDERQQEVNEIKDLLSNELETRSLSFLENFVENLETLKIRFHNDKDFQYAFKEFKKLAQEKINKREEIQGDKLKFFDEHWQDIVSNIEDIPENCIKHYDILDQIGKERDFPPALIAAKWFRESNCRMENPANWDWIFQIISHHHNPWEISKSELRNQVHEYIDFAKAKQDYWDNIRDDNDLQDRFWEWTIDISYDNFSFRDIKLQSILYNWMTEFSDIEMHSYTTTNLSEDINQRLLDINSNINTNRDWVATMFLKILRWEAKERS